MYEPSRQIVGFYIGGFQFWDGALVLNELSAGATLALRAEPDNPHDPNAVALYKDETKLGYIPAGQNEMIAQMLFYGQGKAFEARVIQIDPQAAPWKQVRAALYVADGR